MYSFHEAKNYSMGEGGALLIKKADYVECADDIYHDRMAELAYARDEGIEQGQELVNMINTLNIRLIEDERLDDLKHAAEDFEFRKQLLEEYRIN